MIASPIAGPEADAVRLGSIAEGKGKLPLALTPGAIRGAGELGNFLGEHRDWVHDRMREHGALLLRGFDISSPNDFEKVARGIDDELKNEYLGTSPRDALTDYVFNASELPGYYPIPEHCEMSFVKNHPRRIFFCCLIAPGDGGETPLVDFRRVYADLDPIVRQRFIDGGIKVIRNYGGPNTVASRFDFFQLKPWNDMFRTTDHKVVEETCEREGFEPVWGADDSLRLISRHDAARNHPQTGEPVWFNHALVFHLSSGPGEYRHIYDLRLDWRSLFFWQLSKLLVAGKRLTSSSEQQAMHCTHLDGSEISDEDMDHVRDVVWKNMVIFRWRRGDVVAVDNYSVGHGRLPYTGPRQVVVCWS